LAEIVIFSLIVSQALLRSPSKDKLESELSVLYRNDKFANIKSIHTFWNLVKQNNLKNTFLEVNKLVEIVPTTPV
jgi:hypothetical protein